jgi:hypothetical protein
MKARLVPLYFKSGRDQEFDTQLNRLRRLLSTEAEISEPVELGSDVPDAEAILFPQLVGDAYRQIAEIKRIKIPLLVVTSEFGTASMWDWEIVAFLRSAGVKTFAPYDLERTKKICNMLGIKRELKQTKFLAFQDNPGEGFQASIFKRFFWWEDTCSQLINEKFGITIEKRSFRELGHKAKQIPDETAEEVIRKWGIRTKDVSQTALNAAIKIYIAVKNELEKDDSIKGVGINCLNESHFSDTTPCLAWNMLYEECGIMWACEADTSSLTTEYLLHRVLDVPIMMSNLYPFLMGMAAFKHERIERLPDVIEPENHFLAAHCGYLGVLPESFSTEWTLRPKVLAIVDENATAIDARLPQGKVTVAKLDSTFSRLLVAKGYLEAYVQYPGSDCLNGAVIRVRDGRKLINAFYSHHNCLIPGHLDKELDILAKIFDLEIEEI